MSQHDLDGVTEHYVLLKRLHIIESGRLVEDPGYGESRYRSLELARILHMIIKDRDLKLLIFFRIRISQIHLGVGIIESFVFFQ